MQTFYKMKERKQIVMVEAAPNYMGAKMALALREKGYETTLISISGDTEEEFLKKAYSKRICFDFKYFKN